MAPTFAGTTNHNGVPVTALMLSFLGVVIASVMAVAEISNIFELLMALVTLCVLVVWIMILLTYQAYKKHQGELLRIHRLGWAHYGGRGACRGACHAGRPFHAS